MSADNRTQWQFRATDRGANLGSVLFARLPEALNAYIHRWHCDVIARELLADLPQGAHVLDVGCGYGRLGAWVREQRPDIVLTGLDFTLDFCRYFVDFADAPAVCGDLANTPFMARSFDAILAVTALMYVKPTEVDSVVEGLLLLLRPGGRLLAIDPGAEYLGFTRMFGGSASATGGWGFSLAEYRRLPGKIPVQLGGMPGFSVCVPIALLLRNFPRGLRVTLSVARWADNLLPWGRRFTLHRWMRMRISEDS